MHGITISYDFAGDEADWHTSVNAFIEALNNDPAAANFSYQVAVAGNNTTRVHWGRWDSAETLAHVQAQDYFRHFATRIRGFAGGAPNNITMDVAARSDNW